LFFRYRYSHTDTGNLEDNNEKNRLDKFCFFPSDESFICAAFVFSSYCNSKNKLANNYYNEFSLRLAVSQNADTFLADLIQAAKSNGILGFILYDITLCELTVVMQ
jgi:hypothetical protein